MGESAELVIVDGSAQSNAGMLDTVTDLKGDRIAKYMNGRAQCLHYHHFPSKEHSRTGWFHNEAISRARGSIIVQWDDDDWHDGWRILKQVKTLQEASEGAIAFTSRFYWYHIQEKQACFARTWHQGGGTVGAMLAYHRKVWEKVPFRDVPQGEDNYFWQDHQKNGTMFLDARDPSFCVYMRHNKNGSPLIERDYHDAHTVETRMLLDDAGDLEFYDELSELLPLDPWNRPRAVVSPYQQPWMTKRR